jgi:hypothetical protein
MLFGDLRDIGKKFKVGGWLQRFKQFITHDIKRNPILALYLVIGVMVIGYVIYSAALIYRDIASGGKSKDQVARVQKKRPARKPPVEKKPAEPTPKEVEKPETAPTQPAEGDQAKKPEDAKKLDLSKWQRFEFPDTSHISFPPEWTQSEIPAEKNMLYGIRLQAPDSKASFQCYSRTRQLGDNFPTALKEKMSREADVSIKEDKRELGNLEVTELNGVLADKHMSVSVFDHLPDKYFIVSMIAPAKEYQSLKPYYQAIVDSYGGAGEAASVSIENIEQQLQESIETDKDYLVGSMVKIRLKSGARHRGLVIAEDDNSFTLEAFRFGGKYSFNILKRDIAEMSKE